jgi:hypothetical protein
VNLSPTAVAAVFDPSADEIRVVLSTAPAVTEKQWGSSESPAVVRLDLNGARLLHELLGAALDRAEDTGPRDTPPSTCPRREPHRVLEPETP